MVLWCCSRFGPMRASCFDRNSPIVLAQEPGVRGVPAPREKTAILHGCVLVLRKHIALFGFAPRRPACNKCLTAVDMFVYIAAREKGEHRPLFPHADRSSAVQTNGAHLEHLFNRINGSLVCTCNSRCLLISNCCICV